MNEFTNSSIPRLITSFHPTLSAHSVRSISELSPEQEYGPGTVEYELTTDFLRRSLHQNSDDLRGQRVSAPEIFQVLSIEPSAAAFQSSSTSRYSLPPVLSMSENIKGKTILISKQPPIIPNVSSSPLSAEKSVLEEGLDAQNEGGAERASLFLGSYRVPRGALFFLFGFLFMPIWWYGALFPKQVTHKIELRWKSYNRMMSIVSLIILGIALGLLIWFLSK